MMTKLRLCFIAALTALLAVALAACSSGVKLDRSAGMADKNSAHRSAAPDAQTDPNATGQVAIDPLHAPRSPLAERSVYFDFDKYLVKDEFRPLLQQHAQYLKTHPQQSILLQGNTDERGPSEEYNLALGQRRAQAVYDVLALMGVDDAQMEAVSLGQENARHGEAFWDEDRRVDLIYR